MKTFFYYFITLHWIDAIRSLFQSSADIIIEEFEKNPQMFVNVRARLLYKPDEYFKDFRKLTRGAEQPPLNINLWDSDRYVALDQDSDLTNKEGFYNSLSLRNALRRVPITLNTYRKIGLEGDTAEEFGVDFKSLKVQRSNHYMFDDGSHDGLERLMWILRRSWAEVSKRKGTFPLTCPNCEAALCVDLGKMICEDCEVDVTNICKFPKKLTKMYSDITEYEEKKGEIFLERVS